MPKWVPSTTYVHLDRYAKVVEVKKKNVGRSNSRMGSSLGMSTGGSSMMAGSAMMMSNYSPHKNQE